MYRTFREKYELTQDRAASLIGVTERTWRNWEEGKKVPTPIKNLMQILVAHPELVLELSSQSQLSQSQPTE